MSNDETLGNWRKLHNEEFHKLYSSPNVIRIIKMDEMNRECSMHGREGVFTEETRRKDATKKNKT
jgi:hypothetical protein